MLGFARRLSMTVLSRLLTAVFVLNAGGCPQVVRGYIIFLRTLTGGDVWSLAGNNTWISSWSSANGDV